MSKIIKNSSGISLRFMMATLLLAGVIVKPQNVLAVSGLAANVDPFLGTGSKINPGAILPFGMIIAGPKTTKKDAGYNFRTSGSVKYFLHYNLQGSTLGSPLYVSILPTTGGVGSDTAGTFQHATEVATPGYYKVHLDNFNIDCETTVTQRAALHQYTFVAASSDVRIFVGCNGGTATQVNPTELRGEEGGISYYMIFNKAFNSFNSTDKYATYSVTAGEQIKVKIGMSYTDTTKAKLNMDNELTTWDFNKVKGNAETTWNNYFGKITVAGDETFKKLFYTSMYFGATGIRTISDSDGTYKGRGGGDVKRASGWTKYTGFSLWDNYRATFPLINLISPTEGGDMAHSMIQDYVDAGKTCNWPYANVWKDCMQGSNDDSVIANAYINNLNIGDVTNGMNTLLYHNTSWRGDTYKNEGYYKEDFKRDGRKFWASQTFYSCYCDWAIAMYAQKKGDTSTYNTYIARAHNYLNNLFSSDDKWIRPKNGDGSWVSPWSPDDCQTAKGFHEGGTRQYTWIHHDIQGVINKMGGIATATAKLDETMANFSASGNGGAYYAFSNEPSHHLAYLYNYVGKPYLTQFYVRKTQEHFYLNKVPDLFCGDEDMGQMASWYVLSGMGLYSVTPVTGQYVIGSPLFSKIQVSLPGNKTFTIMANNCSSANKYIQSSSLNGNSFDRTYLTWSEITDGGTLVLNMGANPNYTWGNAPSKRPYSLSPPTMNETPPIPTSTAKGSR